METLKKLYEEEIVPNLTKKFNYTTKISKVFRCCC